MLTFLCILNKISLVFHNKYHIKAS